MALRGCHDDKLVSSRHGLRMRAPTPLLLRISPALGYSSSFRLLPSIIKASMVVGWLFRKLIKLIQARHLFDGLSTLIPTRIIDHNRNESYGIVRQFLCFGTILGCVSLILRAHILVCPLALLSNILNTHDDKNQ